MTRYLKMEVKIDEQSKFILYLKFEKCLVLSQNMQTLLQQEHYGAAETLSSQLFEGLMEFAKEFNPEENTMTEEKEKVEVSKEDVGNALDVVGTTDEAPAEKVAEVAVDHSPEENVEVDQSEAKPAPAAE